MTDMTIKDIRVSMIRMPWQDDPWLANSPFGGMQRDILVVDVETAGGITGMGYLHLLSPGLRYVDDTTATTA